jgi:hypothetical protein
VGEKGWFSSVQRRDAVTGAGESPYPPTETRTHDIAAVVVWQGGLGSWPHHSPGPGSGRQKSRFGRLIPFLLVISQPDNSPYHFSRGLAVRFGFQ